ncbi:MAG: hypothetical protein JWN99_3259 [Ilumatobacteraceae bacterium]|nr:hypothetical protein [Ilumatobacteraceae bacterium]
MRVIGKKSLCGAAATLLLIAASATTASANHGPVVSDPIVDGLAGPLQFEVNNGKVLVAQSFSGTVSTIDRRGNVTDLFNDPGVDGVSAGWNGSVIYTHTDPDNGVVELRLHLKSGETKPIADLHQWEHDNNPDQGQTYGFQGLTPECAALLPSDAGILPYTGVEDSHPYAVTPAWHGWFVAEAAGNDILYVDWHGNITTIAVLPPQAPVAVTAEVAAANELPPCVAGSSFIAEPVPTDVEVGPYGKLYISTLPGGPEDPSLGARGSVYKVNPWNGAVWQIATGFAGATNLAVTPWGDVYVSELFGNQVSKVVKGAPVPIASVPSPTGLEWSHGKLYVGTDSLGSGKIQTITL